MSAETPNEQSQPDSKEDASPAEDADPEGEDDVSIASVDSVFPPKIRVFRWANELGTFILLGAVLLTAFLPQQQLLAIVYISVGFILFEDAVRAAKWVVTVGPRQTIQTARYDAESLRALMELFLTPLLFAFGIGTVFYIEEIYFVAPAIFGFIFLLLAYPVLKYFK